MKIGEKIVLKNLGEVVVLAENKDTILLSKDGVCYFAGNLTKKRQEEEYSYDNVICYGFTVNEVYQLIQPLYDNIIEALNKQYKICDKQSQMVIDAYSEII